MTTTTVYTWNPLTDSVIEESDGSGNSLCTYTNEPSQFGPLISENRGGTTSYYHADAIGSTRLTTNSSQAAVDSFVFDAWGNTTASVQPTPTPHQWCGRWGYSIDAMLRTTYVRERTYVPGIARWQSADPLSDSPQVDVASTLAEYIYLANAPLRAADPSGLDARAMINNTYTMQYLLWSGDQTRANPWSILYGRNNFIFMTAAGFFGGLVEVVPTGIVAASNDAISVAMNRIQTATDPITRGAAYASIGFISVGSVWAQAANAFSISALGGTTMAAMYRMLYS